jgi:hypothetical protein
MPVAHTLLSVREEVDALAASLTPEELWLRPGGGASAGYHLEHLGGALDRLLTYARGESLNDTQKAAAAREGESGDPARTAGTLLAAVHTAIDRALAQVRATRPETLADERRVGRAGLPSTVLGLLFHAAEHAQRHAGQATTTVKIVRGLKLTP